MAMKKPHHTIVKAAQKLGLTITMDEDEYIIMNKNVQIAAAATAKMALAEAIAKLESRKKPAKVEVVEAVKTEAPQEYNDDDDDDDDDDDEGDGADSENRSVIKKKYVERYRPNNYTNGDDFAEHLASYITDHVGEGYYKVNVARLKTFAKENGVWDPRYDELNVGMMRMNIGNRCRAKIRRGEEIVWPK